MICEQLMNIASIVSFNNYENLYFSDIERNYKFVGKGTFTKCSKWLNESWFQWLYETLTLLTYLMFFLIQLLQIYEWMAMLYILNTQKNRRVEEIYYDHNAENIHSREGSDYSKLNYRKKELALAKKMKYFTAFYAITFFISDYCLLKGIAWYLIVPFFVVIIVQVIYENMKYRELINKMNAFAFFEM